MDSTCSHLERKSSEGSTRRMVPPPLNTTMASSIPTNTGRSRSVTISSMDSTMTSTGSYTNHAVTPIRPRAMLPSSTYSFDSGVEVSPLYAQSFRFNTDASDQLTRAELANVPNDMDDNIEGFDEELISIDYHFTPISVPGCGSETATTSSTAFTFTNLATERRNNRLSQRESMAEINNNDPYFPNQNLPAVPADDDLMFDMPFDDEGDDDVFLNENSINSEQEDNEQAMEPRSWHIPRPSCILSESGPDFIAANSTNNRRFMLPSEESVTSSRRSSTPIPIPGSTSESDFDFDAIDGEFPDPSLPLPRTRMPYYHQRAPPLNPPRNLLAEPIESTSNRTSHSATRRTNTFGAHFERSCSIISRHVIPSRFSPVPFVSRWHPGNRALIQPGSFWLRFGQLPASPTYPVRAIPYDFRALTPHFEVDEPESPPAAESASPYGQLVFNFSQLSINEISGTEMDLEVEIAEPLSQTAYQPDDLNGGSHHHQSIPRLDVVPQKKAEAELMPRRDPLPDLVANVACARSSSFTATSTTAARIGKHHHRNTLPNCHEVNNSSTVTFQERRTMSVSLPIEEQVITHVAEQLRQISNDFSSRQIQRYNPLSPVFDLLTSTLYGNTTTAQQQRSRRLSRRQTFSASSTRVVNNSRFYTTDNDAQPPTTNNNNESPPTPTTTGNSTFYVGTTTTTKADSKGRRK